MNMRVLFPTGNLALLLAIIPLAAAENAPVPEQVKQWMQQCKKGNEQGLYADVLPICRRVVDALQPRLSEQPLFASALNNLAECYRAAGNYPKAEPLYLRSLSIREKALGSQHRDVAESLNNLAELYRAQGNSTKAEPLLLRSLSIREKALSPQHPDVAESLNNLAELYKSQGTYRKAEPLYLRSLQILEKALGPEHPYVAIGLGNLADLYHVQGNYLKAEPLYLRSLYIREKVLDPEHPEVADILNNLADFYRAQHNYLKAEPLLLRSLRIHEKVSGSEHPAVAQILNNLALLYGDQGNYPKAEPLLRRSLRIKEKVLGLDHPDVALCLGNLANLYINQHDYLKAEPLLLRSLTIREKTLGPKHPDVAYNLGNLAMVHYVRNHHLQAESLFLRSLHIYEEALGPEHPEVANSLNNLAALYHFQGSPKAEALYLRSLAIWEKVMGPDHPNILVSLDNLALLNLSRGQFALALPRLKRSLGIREMILRSAATEERLTFLLDKMRGGEDSIYSLLLLHNAPAEARELALRVSLLHKGRAAEAGLMTGWAFQASLASDEQRQRFARWQAVRSQHEALFLHGPAKPDDASRQAHHARLAMLNNQIDDMENELARASPQLADWKLPEPEQILAQLAARLSEGSVLVEVVKVNRFQFQATDWQHRWGAARYVALILFPDQRIEVVDLGDAEQMDRSAGELLMAVRDLSHEPLHEAQAMYQKMIAPLLSKLRGTSRMYLSLDGSLNLIPFAALHDGKQYLIDAPYQILYLGSGRDLLRGVLGQSQQPALVMADPDFGSKLSETAESGARTVDVDTRGLYDGLANLGPLKGARAEGSFVGVLLQVPPLLGGDATEARLRQVRSPVILHIATHGLFLNSAMADSRGIRATMVGARPDESFNQMTGRISDSSLSRSALILAGAANAANARDAANDGLLTAEEARSLPLIGTQLVVLSACDTGRGTVKNGQGVYGLRRAFLAAGAQTVVMSLWPVSDTGTQGLMQRYYRLLLDDKVHRGRISALQEAMKAVKAEHPHPYYWAPFIANGLDAPLQFPAATELR